MFLSLEKDFVFYSIYRTNYMHLEELCDSENATLVSIVWPDNLALPKKRLRRLLQEKVPFLRKD